MPNPVLPRIQPKDMPDHIKKAWHESMELRGDATFFEVFAHHPELYDWYTNSFYGQVFRSGLVEQRYKELMRLRLSTTHGCRFCNQGNRLSAKAAGLSDQDIEHITDTDTQHFNQAEQAVLLLADQIVLTNPAGHLDHAMHDNLRNHFSEAQILELGVVAGILSGMAKFLFVFDLVEKEESCPFR